MIRPKGRRVRSASTSGVWVVSRPATLQQRVCRWPAGQAF